MTEEFNPNPTPNFDLIVGNTPLLLVRDGEFDVMAMTASRVTRSDVFAKLRGANVLRLDQVRAVVLETTGDISVLHGNGPSTTCSSRT